MIPAMLKKILFTAKKVIILHCFGLFHDVFIHRYAMHYGIENCCQEAKL